jgi:type IV pilus assembly protein PilM
MADESIWKKELRLRKKDGTSGPPPATTVPEGDRPAPIWKRELKFRSPIKLGPADVAEHAAEPEVAGERQASQAPSADVQEPTTALESSQVMPETMQELAPLPLAEPEHDLLMEQPPTEARPATVHDLEPEPTYEALVAGEPPVQPSPQFDPGLPEAPLTGEPAETFEARQDLPQEPSFSAPSPSPEPPVVDDSGRGDDAPAAVVSASVEPDAPGDSLEEQPLYQPPVEEQVAQVEEAVEAPQAPAMEWTNVVVPDPTSAAPVEDAAVIEIRSAAQAPDADLMAPENVEAPTQELPPPAEATSPAKPSMLKREIKLSRPRRRKAASAAGVAAAATVASASTVETVVQAAPAAPKPKSARKTKTPTAGAGGQASKVKNIVGLRIGSSQLAAAYVQNNGAFELEELVRSPIPRGIVSGGEVRDPEALVRELKRFFTEHKLPRKGVRLGIASNRIGVRVLEVPTVEDPKLFENSIRFHAQEVLPIPVSDAILDYVTLGQGRGQGLEPTVQILLVFAHREFVERHVDVCRRAGLKLEGIDFEAFALLRSLTTPLPEGEAPTQAVVAVAVGNERTIFAVSDGRICDFTRVLEWGGGSLDVAVARALNLTPSQAEPVKLSLALDGSLAPSQLSADEAEAARAAIRTEIQTLARELVSSLQFYQSRPESLDIGSILVSGGTSELNGFAAELERALGVPVTPGDPLSRVELGRRVHRPADAGSFAVAIGLGIED